MRASAAVTWRGTLSRSGSRGSWRTWTPSMPTAPPWPAPGRTPGAPPSSRSGTARSWPCGRTGGPSLPSRRTRTAPAASPAPWRTRPPPPASLTTTSPPPRCCSSRTATAIGAVCLLKDPLPAALPADILDRGEHGDDQTVLLAADEAVCAGEGFRRGLADLLDRLAAEEKLRALRQEQREVMAYLRLAWRALLERDKEEQFHLFPRIQAQLRRLQELDAGIEDLSARL